MRWPIAGTTGSSEALEPTDIINAVRLAGSVSLLRQVVPWTQWLMCKRYPAPSDPPQIDVTIDLEHVKNGFKIWQERTTTSPAGRVIPLYKLNCVSMLYLSPSVQHLPFSKY